MTPELVIAHVSDLHLGAHDPVAVETLPADVAAVRPALTVVTGDLTMRARVPQFHAARALLDRLPAPLLTVLGNHDVPLVGPARVLAPYARYRRWIESDLDPVVEVPGLTALGLQSMPRWRWKSGRVSDRQAGLVQSVLGTAPLGTVRLLALHHPPRTGGLGVLAGRARLFRAIAEAQVDLVLAGHTHLPMSRCFTVRGTGRRQVEVNAGTATSVRVRRGVGRSWTVIRVRAAEIVVEERHQDGTAWRTGRIVRYPR